MTLCILGAGAFGTALAVALSEKGNVHLWGRNVKTMNSIDKSRQNSKLPGIQLNSKINATADIRSALLDSSLVLCAIPLQKSRQVLQDAEHLLQGQGLIGCSKGIDIKTGFGGYSTLKNIYSNGPVGILTGPSFANDIARGLPTALTLASNDSHVLEDWQNSLSTDTLRMYISYDPIGAEIGGALKNVIAIACGAAVGAGLGESARAALITRGHSEIIRYAVTKGARSETLAGLSGFGDLCLTCTSDKSRNYLYGLSLSREGKTICHKTVEGRATAQAMLPILKRLRIDMPITEAVAKICSKEITVSEAMNNLMARPLKKEL